MEEREDQSGKGGAQGPSEAGRSAGEEGASTEGAAAPKVDVPEAHPEGEPTPS